ncbi:MAG TPA: hypothetical protein VKH37_07185, partial [Ferruginibacter sp.]|nr:hypothetical protein [Ferruginibacter sp.]
ASNNDDTVSHAKQPTAPATKPLNTNSLSLGYIQHSDDDLVAMSRKSKIEMTWIFDRDERRGNTTYQVYEIGHDISDKGQTNMRYVPDAWVYVDSSNHKLYEYDAANDSISLWKQK